MAEGPKIHMPARRKARKRALDVLYEADLRDLPPSQVLTSYLDRIEKPHPDHLNYAIGLVEGVAKNLDRIDELMLPGAPRFRAPRAPARPALPRAPPSRAPRAPARPALPRAPPSRAP